MPCSLLEWLQHPEQFNYVRCICSYTVHRHDIPDVFVCHERRHDIGDFKFTKLKSHGVGKRSATTNAAPSHSCKRQQDNSGDLYDKATLFEYPRSQD